MTRFELIQKIEARKKQLNITIENLAKLSGVSVRTINRMFSGEDIKLSTIESVTNLLGLDFAGNEVLSLKQLRHQRAHSKALFMTSLVQGTSSLEMQGLEKKNLDIMISEFEKEFLVGAYHNKLWVA